LIAAAPSSDEICCINRFSRIVRYCRSVYYSIQTALQELARFQLSRDRLTPAAASWHNGAHALDQFGT
jgi:hypothetical protein